MLVLTRKSHESVAVGGPSEIAGMLKVTVLGVHRGKVRLGFEVADDVPIHHWEVWERICSGGLPGQPDNRARGVSGVIRR